jgi:hypothetical protein
MLFISSSPCFWVSAYINQMLQNYKMTRSQKTFYVQTTRTDLCLLLQAMLFTVSLVLHLAIKSLNIHVKTCTPSTGGMKCGLTVTSTTLHILYCSWLNHQYSLHMNWCYRKTKVMKQSKLELTFTQTPCLWQQTQQMLISLAIFSWNFNADRVNVK